MSYKNTMHANMRQNSKKPDRNMDTLKSLQWVKSTLAKAKGLAECIKSAVQFRL